MILIIQIMATVSVHLSVDLVRLEPPLITLVMDIHSGCYTSFRKWFIPYLWTHAIITLQIMATVSAHLSVGLVRLEPPSIHEPDHATKALSTALCWLTWTLFMPEIYQRPRTDGAFCPRPMITQERVSGNPLSVLFNDRDVGFECLLPRGRAGHYRGKAGP